MTLPGRSDVGSRGHTFSSDGAGPSTGCDWLREGVHDGVLAAAYHNGSICKDPSLSAGIARLLYERSPSHAWQNHPRLNPDYREKTEQKFDIGTASHALLLQGEQIVEVIDADDWRKNVAKDARDQARADGKIPLLTAQWAEVQAMAAAIRSQLEARSDDPPILANGKPEQTLVWKEDGITCRARLDWLHDTHVAVDDFKSTGATANPYDWCRRTFWTIGCDVQIAFYLRGLRKLTGKSATWRYVVAETEPPYALSVITPAPSVLELGNRKVEYAIARWRECITSGEWPAYQAVDELYRVEMNAYNEADFHERTWNPETEGVAA